jgi:hypothetical protein
MKINEFINNTDFTSIIKSKFYYYDDRWNFPFGNDVGYLMIEEETSKKLDSITKDKIIKIEKHLNDINLKYEDFSDDFFNEIWKSL